MSFIKIFINICQRQKFDFFFKYFSVFVEISSTKNNVNKIINLFLLKRTNKYAWSMRNKNSNALNQIYLYIQIKLYKVSKNIINMLVKLF